MSAINVFTFRNAAILPCTLAGCRCTFVDEVTKIYVPAPRHAPVVVPRWSIEIDADGTRRLVRHWFENKETK